MSEWTVTPLTAAEARTVARLRRSLDGFTVAVFAAHVSAGQLRARLGNPLKDES